MKFCSKCNTNKEESEFASKNKSKGTLNSNCKECHRKYSLEHYNSNKQYYILKAKKYNTENYRQNRKFVDEYKSSRGCKFCKENDPCCLDFHHVNDDKEFNISNKLGDLSLESLLIEINKCEVICSNCHRKLHAGRFN